MKKIFVSEISYAPTILRILLAVVLFGHGAQKLLGWFNGYGFAGTMDFFTKNAGLSWTAGLVVILIEFFGPLFLLIGFAVRLWAIAITILMIGIIATSHYQYGFFMNWFNNHKGEGYEYFILVIAIALSLLVTGAGKMAADNLVNRSGK